MTENDKLNQETEQEFNKIHKMFEGEKIFAELSHNDAPEFDEKEEEKYHKRANENLEILKKKLNNLGNKKS